MKKPALSTLRNKLWKVFTDYIKQRDGRVCITCRKIIQPGKGLHSGHFINSKICGYDLRYDEYNVNVQCFFCNRNLGGCGALYYVAMVEKYGQEKVNELIERYKMHLKNREVWVAQNYIDKIEYFKNKLKKA